MRYLLKRFLAYYTDGFIISISTWVFFLLHRTIVLNIKIHEIRMPELGTQMIFAISTMVLYFFIFEFLTGRTIGKMIFKLKVLGFENRSIKQRFANTLIRTIFRLNPFDAISIFFYGDYSMWHDRASKTKVVEVINKK